MRWIKIKKIGRIVVFAAAVVSLAVLLTTLKFKTTVDAASLKHIDEIIAANNTYNILEIVPDTESASFGYYIDGQEPIADWKTVLAGIKSPDGSTNPAARSSYVNDLFKQLVNKGILGSAGTTTTPLQWSYYDTTNRSYYTESYTFQQGWNVLHLAQRESSTLTGTFTPAENGAYKAAYAYTPSPGGGYIQNIARFDYSAAPVYGQGDYYYNPVFTKLETGTDFSANWTQWKDVAIYTSGSETYGYIGTVEQVIDNGGFDASTVYYYVTEADSGQPGSFNYKAVVVQAAGEDGFKAATGTSCFSRSITGFTYVGTGGTYSYTNSGSSSYTVYYTDVYYRAGFINNNLFKKSVFGLDNSNLNLLDATVTVRKASDIKQEDIDAASMIYISAGTDITSGSAVTAYSGVNDIPDACAVQIYDFTYNQNPLIIDHSIVQGITQNNPVSSLSNIQKLSLLCLQSSLPLANGSTLNDLTANWSNVWTNLSYISSDTDYTFVNNNVYCFNAFSTVSLSNQPNIAYVVSSLFNEPFSSAVISSGFSPVLAEIRNENFLRTIAGQQTLLPENVTVSNAVRHVINYAGRRMTNPKTKITVLDLEPAKVTAATWLTTDKVRSWINATAQTFPDVNIRIVHMTTGEFVGKIEDLNETYDMVYIGMSTETMNTVNGATVYNDSNMNGLVYSNIGDKYFGQVELAGIRSQDYVNVNGTLAINGSSGTNANLFRFSGNDITKTAATELQKFAMAGYPVILDDGFISGTGISTTTVDNSSYMYKAVTAIYGKFANALKQADAVTNTSLVIKYLNVSKPQIIFSKDNAENPIKPSEYIADTSPSLTRNTNGTDDTGDDYYELNYDFKIDNVTDSTPVSTTYDCRLFVDLNADGRYSNEEELSDIVVHRDSDGALILPTSSSGGEYYALSANVNYNVKRYMPGTYVGIIPWKLEVIKNGADQIHASQQGYTHIAADSSNITTINVLQIMEPGTESAKLNLHTQMNDPQGIYGKLIRGLKDFAVNIDEVTTDVLETKGQTPDEIKNWLETKGLTGQKGYDMLIIGFNDCYDGIKTNSASAIVGYINDGKSVLFTHDTTSLTQTAPGTQLAQGLTTKTVNPNDVLWFTNKNVKSVDGNINWYAEAYDAVSPPDIRQFNPTYVVFMSSNVSSATESAYYSAYVSGRIYKVTGSSYKAISNPSSYNNFKNTTGSAPVIYVYCSSATGWFGKSGYSDRFDIIPVCNFTKFVGTSKYTCTNLTFEYAAGTRPSNQNNYTNMNNTQYDQIIKCLYNTNTPYYLNGSTKYNYTVLGKYDPSANTYNINNATWWPPTNSAFPPSVLYDGNPAYTNTLTAFPNSISDWGYYFNTVIRDFVGLDRYGVTNPAYRSTVEAMPTMTEGLLPAISLVQDTYHRSVALAPKSGGSSVVNEFQGYTNYALIRFAGSGNTYNYMKNTYSDRETTCVSQVNKGQITTYPYNVNSLGFSGNDSNITKSGGSYMQIGKTHEQYFQINMNTDDIVVWYCMSNYSSYNAYTGAITYNDNSYYDDVPNDCVNSYYIYNKGNVTYSGVGHVSDAELYTGTVGQQYINEAKLFVNTMIAAYRSSNQKTNVEIKQDSYGTTNISQKFMLTDEGIANDTNDTIVLQESSGPTDESRAVYFRINDPNVGNKTITAQYYVADPSGPLDKDIGINVVELTTTGQDGKPKPLNTYNTNNEPAELKGGFVYKFYLPDANCLEMLKNDNVNSIKVYVKITTTLGGAGSKPLVSSTFINIYKQQLFMLS